MKRIPALLLAAALVAGGWLLLRQVRAAAAPPVGVFTTLPLLWAEAPDLKSQLAGSETPHWARAVLGGRLEPLDTLAPAPGGTSPLARLSRLLVAQPRPLSPGENLALDRWVRGGGRALVIADPLLTEPSAFALGDPRHPQSVALLSPILSHWGLELTFDQAQPLAETRVAALGVRVPVVLGGRWHPLPGSRCRTWGEGLGATCPLGKGRATLWADAALLERADPDGARAAAFAALASEAFTAR